MVRRRPEAAYEVPAGHGMDEMVDELMVRFSSMGAARHGWKSKPVRLGIEICGTVWHYGSQFSGVDHRDALSVRCGSEFSRKMCFADVVGTRLIVARMAGTAACASSMLGGGRDAHEPGMSSTYMAVPYGSHRLLELDFGLAGWP